MRLLFRLIGLGLIGWALALAAIDIWHGITGGWNPAKFGQVWFDLHADSLKLIQPALERHVSKFLWNPVLTTLLQWPAWAVIGGLGGIVLLLARRRNRK